MYMYFMQETIIEKSKNKYIANMMIFLICPKVEIRRKQIENLIQHFLWNYLKKFNYYRYLNKTTIICFYPLSPPPKQKLQNVTFLRKHIPLLPPIFCKHKTSFSGSFCGVDWTKHFKAVSNSLFTHSNRACNLSIHQFTYLSI